MKKIITILDVGCGIGSIEHQPLHSKAKKTVIHLDIQHGFSCLEIRADAHYLPFKDSSFDYVYASHLLEHVEHPLQVLREFKRISKRVIVTVPKLDKGLYYAKEFSEHLYSWSQGTFKNILGKVFRDVEINKNFMLRKGVNLKGYLINYIISLIFGDGNNELIAKCQD